LRFPHFVQGLAPRSDDGVTVRYLFLRFLADRSGGAAIEYGLIAAGISCVIVGSVQKIGLSLKADFTSLQSSLK